MNKLIDLIKLFIDEKIDFKEFDKSWQKLYIDTPDSGFSEKENEFLDEIHDKEDYVAINEEELQDLRKYTFISVEEFREWLKEYFIKNKEIIKKYIN